MANDWRWLHETRLDDARQSLYAPSERSLGIQGQWASDFASLMTTEPMTDWIIDCLGISKSFGRFVALDDCHLKVPANTIVGLLGPNGSGKTTLLRTLLGFQRPTHGTATVCGFDCVAESLNVRRQVAYLPGDARLFRSMTVAAFWRYSPASVRMAISSECTRLPNVWNWMCVEGLCLCRRACGRKLALSIVLGSAAPLIVLDEPTANLDPNVRSEVVAMVREIRHDGRTVLMSSHIFSDIEDTCDEVVILRSGKLVHRQRLAELDQLHIVQASICGAGPNLNRDAVWPTFVTHHQRNEQQLEMHLSGPPQAWLKWLSELPLADMRIERASVSSIYARFHRS